MPASEPLALPHPSGALTYVLAIVGASSAEIFVGAHAMPSSRAFSASRSASLTLISYLDPPEVLGLVPGPLARSTGLRSCRLRQPLEVLSRGPDDSDWVPAELGAELESLLLPDPSDCRECPHFIERRARLTTAEVPIPYLRMRGAGWLSSGAAWLSLNNGGGYWRFDGDRLDPFRGCELLGAHGSVPLGDNRFVIGASGGRVARIAFDEARMTCSLEAMLRDPGGETNVFHVVGSPDGQEIYILSSTGAVARSVGGAFTHVHQAEGAFELPRGTSDGGLAWLGPGQVAGTIASDSVFFRAADGAVTVQQALPGPGQSRAFARVGTLGIALGTNQRQIFVHPADARGTWSQLTTGPAITSAYDALAPFGSGLIANIEATLEVWTPLTGWCRPFEISGGNGGAEALLVDEARHIVLVTGVVGDADQTGYAESLWLDY